MSGGPSKPPKPPQGYKTRDREGKLCKPKPPKRTPDGRIDPDENFELNLEHWSGYEQLDKDFSKYYREEFDKVWKIYKSPSPNQKILRDLLFQSTSKLQKEVRCQDTVERIASTLSVEAIGMICRIVRDYKKALEHQLGSEYYIGTRNAQDMHKGLVKAGDRLSTRDSNLRDIRRSNWLNKERSARDRVETGQSDVGSDYYSEEDDILDDDEYDGYGENEFD